jgi:hypothetical protein
VKSEKRRHAKKINYSTKMKLFISIKGMQAKVSASIANAEQEVPGHIVGSITEIAERTLREALQSVSFVAGVCSSNV